LAKYEGKNKLKGWFKKNRGFGMELNRKKRRKKKSSTPNQRSIDCT